MPLLVHCPNRCQIRVPANRVGKVIRCIDCQTPIMIPEVDSPLLRTGNWVECRAKRAIKKSELAASDNTTNGFSVPTPSPSPQATPLANATPEPSIDSAANTALPVEPQTAKLLRAKPWRTVEPLTSVDPDDSLTPIDLEVETSPEDSTDD